jgi:hypothetical protein
MVGDQNSLETQRRSERFRKHNIFLKPKKCKFGMAMVEYCGNEILKKDCLCRRKKDPKGLGLP